MKFKINQLNEVYVFSPWLRLFHWIMGFSMPVLFLTGLYIGNPFYIGSQGIEPTYAIANFASMANVRYIHFLVAYILLGALVLRVYGYCINKGDRLLPRFDYFCWEGMFETIRHYLFLKREHRLYLRNPLARLSYLGFYLLLIIQFATGFAMYSMVNPNSWLAKVFGPLNFLFFDERVVHHIHHYVAWLIVLFAIVHLYMVIRTDLMEKVGEASSMISGAKFFDKQPHDIRDLH